MSQDEETSGLRSESFSVHSRSRSGSGSGNLARLSRRLVNNRGGTHSNRTSTRATGTLDVLNPMTVDFDASPEEIGLRGIMHVYSGIKWRECYAVLRKNCIFQYADKNESQLVTVIPLGGSKLLELGQKHVGKFAESDRCAICKTSFTLLNRRHHCRSCFRSCCTTDSSDFIPIPSNGFFSPVRCCNECRPLSVYYLECLPLSLDDNNGLPNPKLFTLPLQDRDFVFCIKNRAQEVWLGVKSAKEQSKWLAAIRAVGIGAISPPKDLIIARGKVNKPEWERMSGKVSKKILQCRTDDDIFEVSKRLNHLQISSLKKETRSIIRDIREAAESQTAGAQAAGASSKQVNPLSEVADISDSLSSLQNVLQSDDKERESYNVYSERQPRLSDYDDNFNDGKTGEFKNGSSTRKGVDCDSGNSNNTQTPKRKKSALLRDRARLMLQSARARSPEHKRSTGEFKIDEEVFITDRNGYFRKTGMIISKEDGYYEVKSEGDVEKISGQNLVKFPKVGFKWRKGKPLGEGQYGVVYSGFNTDHGTHIAIKQMPLKIKKSRAALQDLYKEVQLMQMADHPNIVGFLGCQLSLKEKAFYIFMEQVSGGSLHKVLSAYGKLNENVACGYTQQILHGLEYLHLKGVVHRDLKCANVLLTTEGVCKLADFGVSKQIKDECQENSLQTAIGSPYWMAPEVILEDGYGRAADIWSLGCTVVEMVTAAHPWKNLDNPYTACYTIAQSNDLPYVPSSLSEKMREFIFACLQRDKQKRPSSAELWRLEWIREEDPPDKTQD